MPNNNYQQPEIISSGWYNTQEYIVIKNEIQNNGEWQLLSAMGNEQLLQEKSLKKVTSISQ